MKIKVIVSGVLVLVCTVGPIVGTWLYDRHVTSDLTAEILARAPEKGNYSPRFLSVPLGERVKLRVRNIDTVTHGFTIPGLQVDAGEIKAGHSVILEFTPEKVGKHDFYCTVWCGENHLQMKGVLEVAAK
jgi:heme/copper-type cytochrome/quinol oxidase subunit 2